MGRNAGKEKRGKIKKKDENWHFYAFNMCQKKPGTLSYRILKKKKTKKKPEVILSMDLQYR